MLKTVLLISTLSYVVDGIYKHYNKTVVSNFLDAAVFLNISADCAVAISKKGFNMFKCFHAAAEKDYSISEYPFDYCYGTGEDGIDYAVCLPSVCFTDYVQLLREWSLISEPPGTAGIVRSECLHSRKEKQWYQMTGPLAELSINTVFVFLVSMATAYDCARRSESRTAALRVFMAFSIKKNLKKLSSAPKSRNNTIECLFGLRFLSLVWVLVGHSFAWVQSYIENVDEFQKDMSNSFFSLWITNHTLCVANFFLISAMLTSFLWFSKMHSYRPDEKPTWRSYGYWFHFYRHRIIRLWPAYFYSLSTITFRSTTLVYHSALPPSDPYVQCKQYWWQNILFINIFTETECLGWTWYISVEFILFAMSPVFMLLLRDRTIYGFIISVGVIIVNGIIVGCQLYVNNYPATPLPWTRPKNYDDHFYKQILSMYIKPHCHVGAYMIGLIAGYMLENYSAQLLKYLQSRSLVCSAWLLSALIAFFSLQGLFPIMQDSYWPVYNALYGATFRNFWSLSMAWLIVACHLGHGGFVNKFLSCRIFLPLAGLSYSVYLGHMIWILTTYSAQPFPIVYHGKYQFIYFCTQQLLMSYALAVFPAFIAEFPAINLETMLFSSGQKSLPKQRECERLKVTNCDECTDHTH